GEQTYRLPCLKALLGARTVLLAVLADLQITGKVDDLTHKSGPLRSRIGLPIHSRSHSGGGPERGRLLADGAGGLFIAAGLHRHLGLKDARAFRRTFVLT